MALQQSEIAERIKELRESRGNPPQEVVAPQIGVSHRTYQAWELGEAKPGYRNLSRLAAFYGVTEEYILAGSGSGVAAPNADRDLDLARIERKLDALLAHAKIDPADFDGADADGVADIVNAAAGSIAALGGEAPATPPSKRVPARKRAAS